MSFENFFQSLFDTADIKSPSLANELDNLRNDFAKFHSSLLMNELKIELNYLVDQLRENLANELRLTIDQVNYEISLLSAKICALEIKLDQSMSEQVRFF